MIRSKVHLWSRVWGLGEAPGVTTHDLTQNRPGTRTVLGSVSYANASVLQECMLKPLEGSCGPSGSGGSGLKALERTSKPKSRSPEAGMSSRTGSYAPGTLELNSTSSLWGRPPLVRILGGFGFEANRDAVLRCLGCSVGTEASTICQRCLHKPSALLNTSKLTKAELWPKPLKP